VTYVGAAGSAPAKRRMFATPTDAEELEHRRVIRRVADIDHRTALAVHIDGELLAKQLAVIASLS